MIFLFQRILTHYNFPIYKKLNHILNNCLVVIYGQQPKKSHFFDISGEHPFKTVKVRNIWVNGESAVWQNFYKPFQIYGRADAVIMEQSPRILSLLPLFIYCKLRKIPFILWGHGGSRKRDVSESNNPKDIFHRWLIRNADAFISYTDGIKENLSRITDREKIFVARNTLDTDKLFSIRKKLEKEGKDKVKERLNLDKSNYLCFIGRLIADKCVDYLIDVYELVKLKFPDSGLLIIGEGPEENALRGQVFKKKMKDVHFLGGIANWEESGEYIYASDVMVIPGYVGLAVNHAFCLGLPVITQASDKNGPFHSPEIEYIIHEETGFICQKGNKEEMSLAIAKVFENKSTFNLKVVEFCENNLSCDTMVEGIKKAIAFAMNSKMI